MARNRLHAPEAQPVTFVERFFDLVFVFAITQVTALTAHHLDPGGVARSVLLFWLIWWAWTQFTWTLNPADTRHTLVQALTLAATAAAFVMAASVPHAFDEQALWFAVPYVLIRAVGIGLQVRVDHERTTGGRGVSMLWVHLSLAGLLLVVAGAAVDRPARTLLWLAVPLVDFLAAALSNRGTEWDVSAGHFSERHGLFVIIALGESLIVAAAAVAEDPRTADLILVAGAALAVACLLWWTYFGWLKESMEEAFAAASPAARGALARDAYSLAHFPLVCGIIGFAVAVEELVAHPDHHASAAVIGSLVVGIALFIGASAFAHWRLVGSVPVARLAITGAAVAVAAMLGGQHPALPLTAVAGGLLAVVLVEGRPHDRADEHPIAVD